ncbi:pyridoxal phosphate-dependent aminotransferase [Tissierella sp. MSJ-40]|uniref:Pyridoxal phosphate-dependent aminotransferase n=1 Tax=Tissierella simiarum TaxID=2841534 RepID=A0ABS6E4V0_9FIRM|nr:MalY/PatB family protein [Tissierella simiarum]MBU5437940.1 pyridoxal phosphate-dependent aminotransferase [Tissierella simiarum]
MKYNFDEIINRKDSHSIKWSNLEKTYGDKDILPMWIADMDFKVADEILEGFMERVNHGVFGYDYRPASYYEAVINWVKKRHGWDIKKEWILFTPGVVMGLNLAVVTLTKKREKIIIQPPIYPPFSGVISRNERAILTNPLRHNGEKYIMDYNDLEKKIDNDTKLMLLCSPHNPTGRVWAKDELEKLGEICLKNNIIIVSDEIHSDLIFKGHKHTTIASISEELAMNTITLMAPSKTFNIAGLFTSVAIIPNKEIRDKFVKTIEILGIDHNSTFGAVGLEAAYNHGETWLEEVLEYIEDNLDYTMEYVKNNIPKITIDRPEGTFLVWLNCTKLGLSQEELNELMIKTGKVLLNDGMTFGKEGEGFLRLNIGCSRSTLEEALKRIEKAVKSLKN